jgi:catechol 2,3-dioxygenase-like lactoylglutathione lyase family enzyme
VTIELNGMAHVILTVSRFEVAREFYRKLLPEFGMKPSHRLFYSVGARTAFGIEPCDAALAGERFVQQRVDLHRLCLRARSREDVDRCAAFLKEDARIVRGPMEGSWAPGYYYVRFDDPDGIRLVHRLKNVITQLEREGANTFLPSRRRPGPIPTIGTGLRRYYAVAA